jgi:hypothetical protein
MARRFLTVRDLEEMAARGVTRVEIDDNTTVTDAGRDRARALGIALAPVAKAAPPTPPAFADPLHARVRAAVIAQLGGTPENLDAIISRVLAGMKNGG